MYVKWTSPLFYLGGQYYRMKVRKHSNRNKHVFSLPTFLENYYDVKQNIQDYLPCMCYNLMMKIVDRVSISFIRCNLNLRVQSM